MQGKTRIAFLEEWPSLRANRVMPYLSQEFAITYITCDMGAFPKGDFTKVIKFPPPKFMYQRAWQFATVSDELYREKRIDFAYVYSGIGFLIRRTPYIHFVGGSALEDFKIRWRRTTLTKRPLLLKGLIHYSFPEFVACRRASHIVTNSLSLKEDIRRNYKLREKKVSMVYNGVDEDLFDLYKNKSGSLGHNILYTGRLHYRKGILDLVKAYHHMRNIECDFYIAGSGPDWDGIAAVAAVDPRIKLVGNLEKRALKELMKNSSIFLFPSFHEGCPNSLLEAMASGHACLGYGIPSVAEVLNGCGILVDVGRPDNLCKELEGLLSNPMKIKSLAGAAFERAKCFSWDRCALELAGIFGEMDKELRMKAVR